MTEKRFNDEEVSLILRRALEADAGRAEGGLTLGQLKEIAAEVGIPAAHVESAALALQAERGVRAGKPGLARVATRYDVEVPGEVERRHHAHMLRVIRGAMGRQGVAQEEFGGLTWKARDPLGGRYITVRSENGRTRIEALGNFRDGAMVGAGAGGTIGLAVGAMVLKSVGGLAAVGVLGPVGLVAAATLPAYLIYRRMFVREDTALREAVTALAAQVEAGAAQRDPEDKPTKEE
ncbi:MAG TPA: hypothetical protein VLA36_15335 [Longimicrobiales bacterium]|nr:hypothetical protein [Longimicrobiales bacterium]